MSSQLIVWRIAVPAPLARLFDYLPPENAPELMMPGIRVLVPFGARQVVGIFLSVETATEMSFDRLKSVVAVLDTEPVLSAAMLKLCYWASDYYHHPLGEVLMTALPKHLRAGKQIKPKTMLTSSLTADEPFVLNTDQQQAVTAILEATQFRCFLLAGVTGSGKTEVYLQVIAAVLARHQQALLLVPEISLTPQTVQRFQQRFAVPIAVLHSGMTDKARSEMWWHTKTDMAAIVIGTRSAIFAPLPRLGIIIVDEEHDLSFKSQSGVRYSARDLAVMRAFQNNLPIVLGSATPSIESYYNVKRGRYVLLSLPLRAGNAQLPMIRVLDLRRQQLTTGLSTVLIDALRAQLARGKQVLLFINRRGYAPVMMCHQCGYIVVCTRCDAKLTLHMAPKRLICHHCEKVVPPVRVCPKCHQADLMTLGQGTEQLEETLQHLFPTYKVLRIDRDTTSTKNSLHKKLLQINAGEAHILVGTQMLAKGHHFTNLGLSAIVDIDSAFFSTDYRAIERMAQLMIQVSGRAGRGDEVGEVILQTHHPEHPALQQLVQQHYFAFLETLLQERQLAGLPPFCHHALIQAESTKRHNPVEFLRAAKALIQHDAIQTFGPIPSALERKAGKFRQQLLVQSHSRLDLQAALQPFVQQLSQHALARTVRWSIDVDPCEGVS